MTAQRFADEHLERLPREELRRHQLALLRRLLEDVWATNAFYRERWQAAGVRLDAIRSHEDFTAAIPTVDKAAFLADQEDAPPFGRRLGQGVDELGQIHMTSGTSGLAQEVHAIGRSEIAAMGSGYHFLFKWAGIEPGMRALLTFKLSTLAGGQTYTQGVMSYPLVTLFAADKTTEDKVDLLRTYDVEVLQAFSGYLQRLRSVLEARDMEPRKDLPALRAIVTGLQAYDVDWMQEAAAYWGVPLAEHYGSTQTTLHMATCEQGPTPGGRRGMLHNFGSLVHVEVIDPDTGLHVAPGEEGEIVVTTLFRRLVPVVRFRLNDKARYLPASACQCGRPFDGVEAGTISRYDDMLKVKGVNFWPQTGDAIVLSSPVVEDFVGEVAFTKTGGERVTLRIEPRAGAGEPERVAAGRDVARAFKEKVGFSVAIEWTQPGELPRFDYKVKRWIDRRRLSATPEQAARTDS
jgi:phenylacetate-CoA ligase